MDPHKLTNTTLYWTRASVIMRLIFAQEKGHLTENRIRAHHCWSYTYTLTIETLSHTFVIITLMSNKQY